MRQRNYLVDNMVSTSLFLSWQADEVKGKTYRITVPMLGRYYDMRGLQQACFSTFEDIKVLSDSGVKVLLTGADKVPSSGSATLAERQASGRLQPELDVRYTLQFDISFTDDISDATNALLTVWGKPIATSVAPPQTWTSVAATSNPPITVTDTGNAPVPVGAEVLFIPEGSDGKSAYEIAVENGFIGDESAWLASLKGADGSNGSNGTNGVNGHSIEIQNSGTHIQWRLDDGQDTWHNVIAIDDLKGADGAAGSTGAKGDTGEGVPQGGTTGQILSKNSGSDYDTKWIDASQGGGGSAGERLEWQIPSSLSNKAYFKKRINAARTLKWFKCDVLSAPSNDTTFDIKKNGTSIFTSAPKPVLEDGVSYVETNGFDSGADVCSNNDVFQLIVDSGSGAADVNVTLYFE